jgi:hypothetical protein
MCQVLYMFNSYNTNINEVLFELMNVENLPVVVVLI